MTAALDVVERWSVNDLGLDGPAWGRDPGKGGKGLAMSPPRRDTSTPVPGRRGVLPGPVEYDAGLLVFNLWVLGVDPSTGRVPAGSSTELELARNISTLMTEFHRPVLDCRRVRPDGEVRRAAGTLSQVVDPDIQNTYPAYAELGVALRIDDAFWFDADPVTAQLDEVVSGATVPLWAFDGAEAALDDLTYVIGPAWNPVVTDVGSRTWLAYDGVIQPGQALLVDAGAREVRGLGDLVVDQGLVRRGRWLTLSPGRPPAITVTHTGPDPVQVQVSGRRAFLTA